MNYVSNNFFSKLKKILFLPIVILIRLISPLIYIRISPIKVARIGHLAGEMEIYFCKKEMNKKKAKTLDLFYIRKNEKICNKFLFDKIKKKIIIIPSFFGKTIYDLNLKINKVFFFKKKYFVDLNMYRSSSFFNLSNQQIILTENEIQKGQILAKKINILPNDNFVCLECRDAAYLKKYSPNKNFDYHSYRNSNINDFIKTCEFLTKKGFKVVRIGNFTEEKIKTKNPMIIDYPNTNYVDDFLDIYLVSQCKFMLTTASGMSEVGNLFRKPFVVVNYSPLGLINYKPNKNFLIFKKYFSKRDERFLSVSETFENKSAFFTKIKDFQENQIELIKNSPEEILDVTKDCLNYLSSNNLEIDSDLQNKFWKIYMSKRKKFFSNHSCYFDENLNCIINNNFLKKNESIVN